MYPKIFVIIRLERGNEPVRNVNPLIRNGKRGEKA
jgi:hypothetical protein